MDLNDCFILKNGRIMQTLFYLLGFEREQICFRGTNKFNLKQAKQFLNEDLLQRMGTYNPQGRRAGVFKEYQKLTFLKQNLHGFDEEKLAETNLLMARILQWIWAAIQLRQEDVIRRRDNCVFVKLDRAK